MRPSSMLYFHFEEDFIDDDVRCIPMIVRFKLDACLVKLKLAEWSRLNVSERENLAILPCSTLEEIIAYKDYLCHAVRTRTGNEATPLAESTNAWANKNEIPHSVRERAALCGLSISLIQWQHLNTLQRFALLKLSQSAHEHKNFPRALHEFNLL